MRKFLLFAFAAVGVFANSWAGVSSLQDGVYENEKYCDVQIQSFSEIKSNDLMFVTTLDCGSYTLSSNVFMCGKDANNCTMIMGRTKLAEEDCNVEILGKDHFVQSCTWGDDVVRADYKIKAKQED